MFTVDKVNYSVSPMIWQCYIPTCWQLISYSLLHFTVFTLSELRELTVCTCHQRSVLTVHQDYICPFTSLIWNLSLHVTEITSVLTIYQDDICPDNLLRWHLSLHFTEMTSLIIVCYMFSCFTFSSFVLVLPEVTASGHCQRSLMLQVLSYVWSLPMLQKFYPGIKFPGDFWYLTNKKWPDGLRSFNFASLLDANIDRLGQPLDTHLMARISLWQWSLFHYT